MSNKFITLENSIVKSLSIAMVFLICSSLLYSCKTKTTVSESEKSLSGQDSNNSKQNGALPSYAGGYFQKNISDVIVTSDRVYLAVGGATESLRVIDRATQETLLSCDTCKTISGTKLIKHQQRIFMAGKSSDGHLTLEVIDISNPSILKPIFYYTDVTTTQKIATINKVGTTIYIAMSGGDIKIIDVSKLSKITQISKVTVEGDDCQGSAVKGDTLYGIFANAGVKVYNILNKNRPTLIRTIPIEDYGDEIYVDGDNLIVSDWEKGFKIYDLSIDDKNPSFLSSTDTSGKAHYVLVKGNILYSADAQNGVAIYDISNPSSPSSIKNLDDGSANTYLIHLVENENIIYSFDSTMGLRHADISNPATAVNIGTAYKELNSKRIDGIAVRGKYTYIALTDNSTGMAILDNSDPSSPNLLGSYTIGTSNAHDIVLSGNHAFMPNGGTGLVSVDITDPANPTFAGAYNTPGYAVRLQIVGNTAYVSDNNSIQIIDITDPINMTLISSIPVQLASHNISATKEYLTIGERTTGLSIYDVKDPNNPTLIKKITAKGDITYNAISGNYIYFQDNAVGLRAFDITNASSPIEIMSAGINSKAKGAILINDGKLFTGSSSGMTIYSIEAKGQLTLDGVVNTGTKDFPDFAFEANFLHIAAGSSGLAILKYE